MMFLLGMFAGAAAVIIGATLCMWLIERSFEEEE